MIKTKLLKYTVIYTSESEGGFTVTVPSLPGCVTYGKDLTEAKKMAEDAIRLYLESLQKHKEIIPYHLKQLPKGTFSAILRESQVSKKEFENI